MNRTRPWSVALTALAVAAAVLIPAALAAGSHGGDAVSSGSPSFVQLSMSNGSQDAVTWTGSSTAQSIATKRNDCTAVTLGTAPEYLALTAIGGRLGEVKDGFGVQSAADGGGEPCGRVEAADAEAISVSLGATLSDLLMRAVDVDLELKFNASVTVTYLHDGIVVHTDVFDPTDGSDDGPDSGDLDNYRYAHRPGVDGVTVEDQHQLYFDEVVFTPTSGSLSLEGGADGTEAGSLTAGNGSQFEVVATFDGEITCGETADIGAAGIDTTYGTVTVHSMDSTPATVTGWESGECPRKPYNDGTGPNTIAFVPELEGTQARYTWEVTVEDQLITTNATTGQITSLGAKYNLDGSLDFPDDFPHTLQSCTFEPPTDQGDPLYQAFWEQNSPVDNGVLTGAGDNNGTNLLPSGQTICFFGAEVVPTGLDSNGNQRGTEYWKSYFEDDPGKSFI